MARRVSRPQQLDLFATPSEVPASPQLALGLETAPAAPQSAARELAARQTRLAQLEQQRDTMRAQGWAVADLDDQINRLRAGLLRDLWDSPRRNPRVLRPITLPNRGISPTPGTPAYSANKMFLAGGDHLLHPLRRNLLAQGIYNRDLENSHRKAKRAAIREGLIGPEDSGSIAQIVERLRERGNELHAESIATEETPQERLRALSPSERADLDDARAELKQATTREQRGYWRREVNRLSPRSQLIAGYLARPAITAKSHLSDRDWLKVAAIVRERHGGEDADWGSPDWASKLPANVFQEARRRSFSPEALGAGSRVNRAKAARDARDAFRRADMLEQRFLPRERLDHLAADYATALETNDFKMAERLEKQMAPLETALRSRGPKAQRFSVNPDKRRRARRWLVWWPVQHNPTPESDFLLERYGIGPLGGEEPATRSGHPLLLPRYRPTQQELVAGYGPTSRGWQEHHFGVTPAASIEEAPDEGGERITRRQQAEATRAARTRDRAIPGEGFELLPAPQLVPPSGPQPTAAEIEQASTQFLGGPGRGKPLQPNEPPEGLPYQRTYAGPFEITREGYGQYRVTGPTALLPERSIAERRRKEEARAAGARTALLGESPTLAGALALSKQAHPLKAGALPAREEPTGPEPYRPLSKEERTWRTMLAHAALTGGSEWAKGKRAAIEAQETARFEGEQQEQWERDLARAATEGERLARRARLPVRPSSDEEEAARGTESLRAKIAPALTEGISAAETTPEASTLPRRSAQGRTLRFAHRSTRAVTRSAAQLALPSQLSLGVPSQLGRKPPLAASASVPPDWEPVRDIALAERPRQQTFLNPFTPCRQRNPLPALFPLLVGTTLVAIASWGAWEWWERRHQIDSATTPALAIRNRTG